MTKNYATPHSEHPLHTELEFLKLCSIKKKKKKEKRECVYYPFLWLMSIRWRHFLPARLEEVQ